MTGSALGRSSAAMYSTAIFIQLMTLSHMDFIDVDDLAEGKEEGGRQAWSKGGREG